MTFRNTCLIIFSFLLLSGCKGVQYYRSGTNPAGISILLQGPSIYYYDEFSGDIINIAIVNHNSEPITIVNWWKDLTIIGQSRFYKKELITKFPQNDPTVDEITIDPNDTLDITFLPTNFLLANKDAWSYKGKPCKSPHLVTSKKTHPYIYLSVEMWAKVVNQENIKVRSNSLKINIQKKNTTKITNKKSELSLTCDTKVYNTETKNGNLFCKVTNLSQYPIPLLSDPGSVRFAVYAYNPNRTSVMHTEYILDNGKLPVNPITIPVNSNHTITIPLHQLLFNERPADATLFWTWNKKQPPISPLVYGKTDMAMNTEFWFGIVIDGQEFLSNTIMVNIDSPSKKSIKK